MMLKIDKVTPQQLLKESAKLSLTAMAKKYGCSRDTVKRRIGPVVGGQARTKPKTKEKARPKTGYKPDGTRPPCKLAMVKIMGNETQDKHILVKEMARRGWLPRAKDPLIYIGYLLSTNKELFEKDEEAARGFYRVRRDNASSALIAELEAAPLLEAIYKFKAPKFEDSGSSETTLQVLCKGERWRAMKGVWDACDRAGMEVPREVRRYFNGEPPTPEGIVVSVPVEATNPVSFNRRDLPEEATSVQLTVPLAGLAAETEFTLWMGGDGESALN